MGIENRFPFTGHESDLSDNLSEVDTDLSNYDSEAEDFFLEGGDITLDKKTSDEDYEPDTPAQVSKRPRTAAGQQQETSSSSSDDPPQRGSASRRRPRGRGRGRGSSRTKAGASTSPSGERWNDVDIPDITPPQPTFRPTNPPGPQLIRTATYTALQLFQLFWTNSVLQTILLNTNEFGSTHHSTPTHPWIDLTLQDMFTFMSMVIYMGLVKCSAFTDYWQKDKLHSFPFPKQVMTGKKFLRITRSLHLSSMADDATNEQRRGTAAFNRLCKINPVYQEIREACKRNYHPGQDIAIDERMVASKARIGLKQYMNNKPVRWGYKLFVLADSKNGYTWDFFVY
ncbi:piggyBac transposable element-derived protein 4-like [Osmerus eperlanus]|uniref:piggyBac transposable element-derived protein 4-like n=1 Tax=Osmerus eperlanus TaxID=29151 RepID=UPI002E0DE9EC